jgi:membrane-bound lytic murein transglycosylase MltF
VFNPKANAIAAAYYMGTLGRQWSSPRPDKERLRLAQASYNAGFRNILNAQEKCGGALFWKDIEPCLGFSETTKYVIKIEFYFNKLTINEGCENE